MFHLYPIMFKIRIFDLKIKNLNFSLILIHTNIGFSFSSVSSAKYFTPSVFSIRIVIFSQHITPFLYFILHLYFIKKYTWIFLWNIKLWNRKTTDLFKQSNMNMKHSNCAVKYKNNTFKLKSLILRYLGNFLFYLFHCLLLVIKFCLFFQAAIFSL